jgi:hypothetical protein
LDRPFLAVKADYQISLAFRLGYLAVDAHRELSELSIETSKVITGLLRALRQ